MTEIHEKVGNKLTNTCMVCTFVCMNFRSHKEDAVKQRYYAGQLS